MTANELWNKVDSGVLGVTRAVWDERFRDLVAVSLHGDVLTLKAEDSRNLEWLEGRGRIKLEPALSGVADRPIRLAFTLNGHQPQPIPQPQPPAPVEQPEPKAEPVVSDPTIDLARLDVRRGHWIKQARYIALYWHPYFCSRSQFVGARALAIWQWLRDQFDANQGGDYWTPVEEYKFGEIARLTGSTSQQVLGVLRQCREFNKHLTETGQPLTPCQSCYRGARQSLLEPEEDYPEGRPVCQYRRAGALEVLAREGWIAIERSGTGTRDMGCEIQVYRYPPFLTPFQVAAWPDSLKEAHEAYLLNEYSVSIPTWRNIEVESFMDLWQETEGLRLPLLRKEVYSAFARKDIFLSAD